MERREKEDLEALKEAIEEDPQNKDILNEMYKIYLQQEEVYKQLDKERHQLEKAYEAKFEPMKQSMEQTLTQKPIEGFWLEAMRNHQLIGDFITEKDELLLKFLRNVKGFRHTEDLGFTLEFQFSENPYITNQVLTKKFFMSTMQSATKIEGTEIQWKSENFTQKQVKKKQKHKKSQQTRVVTKNVKAESFFNFFETCNFDEGQEAVQEEEMIDKAEEEIDIGREFLEELIPFALPYFLGLREGHDFPREEDMEDFEDEDSEDEEHKKGGGKKKGGKKGGAGPPDAGGDQKAECKQQ